MSNRVLVVDDDAAIRRLTCRVLQRERYETAEARDGEEAIERLRGDRYCAVILDLMMPNVSGFEVLLYLDAHVDVGALCVIVLSAISEPELQAISSPHVHAVIRKPFELPELIEAVRACGVHRR